METKTQRYFDSFMSVAILLVVIQSFLEDCATLAAFPAAARLAILRRERSAT